jgi:hypothetical protein
MLGLIAASATNVPDTRPAHTGQSLTTRQQPATPDHRPAAGQHPLIMHVGSLQAPEDARHAEIWTNDHPLSACSRTELSDMRDLGHIAHYRLVAGVEHVAGR